MKNFKLLSIHVILPIIIGGLIYISFRSSSLRLFNWFDNLGIHDFVYWLRSITKPLKNIVPSWTYFSLPDGLWSYSFCSAYILLWGDQFQKGKYWLFIPFALSVIVELGQRIKIFPGTFDIIDFTFSIVALSFSIIILKPKLNKNEIKKDLFQNL